MKYEVVRTWFLNIGIYEVVFSPLSLDIYLNEDLITSILTPYTAAQINYLGFRARRISITVLHKDHAPRVLRQEKINGAWEFVKIVT